LLDSQRLLYDFVGRERTGSLRVDLNLDGRMIDVELVGLSV